MTLTIGSNDVVRELAVISSANDTLRQYHQQRRAALTS
jgi:hypothetical protein